MNLYATKKTAAEGMLDIALFLANITHMKTVIEQGAGYRCGPRSDSNHTSVWQIGICECECMLVPALALNFMTDE